jgi:hypothetical protein
MQTPYDAALQEAFRLQMSYPNQDSDQVPSRGVNPEPRMP